MEFDGFDRFDLTGQVLMPTFGIPAESGCYSLIYRGIWRGSPVAVKVIKSVGGLRAMRRKVRRERTVWEALEHPNILPFYGHADDEHFGPFGAFISPWCFNGDVGRFLAEHGRHMEVAERVKLWRGVLSGVGFLHGLKPVIVHGDLKPGNVLIDNHRKPRICDFGLARIIQEAGASGMTTTTEHTGTERYLAPELVVTGSAKPTTASDVYALGCLCLEFIYLERPYAHQQNNHLGCIIIDIRDGVTPATRQEDIHSPLDFWWGKLCSWELIEALWYPDPEGRPAAVSVMRHLDSPNLGFDDTHIIERIDEPVYYSPLDQAGDSIYHEERHANALQLAHTAEILPQFGGLLNYVASGIPDISQQNTPSSHPLHLSPASYVNSHMSLSSSKDETSNPLRSPDRVPSPYNDETISNRAVILTPDGQSDRPSLLSRLGTALHSRFTRRGEPADLEEAISMLQEAVDLTLDGDPDKSRRLSNLGAALQSRFMCRGELVDIEKAISMQQQAVELTPDGHPDKSSMISNLGIALHSRFILGGEVEDIEGAILNLQHAVELTSGDYPDKSSQLSNLELALLSQSMRCDGHAEIGRPSRSINSQSISHKMTVPTAQELWRRLGHLAI